MIRLFWLLRWVVLSRGSKSLQRRLYFLSIQEIANFYSPDKYHYCMKIIRRCRGTIDAVIRFILTITLFPVFSLFVAYLLGYGYCFMPILLVGVLLYYSSMLMIMILIVTVVIKSV